MYSVQSYMLNQSFLLISNSREYNDYSSLDSLSFSPVQLFIDCSLYAPAGCFNKGSCKEKSENQNITVFGGLLIVSDF